MDRDRNHGDVENKRKQPLARGRIIEGPVSWYTRRDWSIINRTGRPTYPLNSKSHPPAAVPPCPRHHRHRNSLSFRENPLTTTSAATRRFSLSPSPSSRRHPDIPPSLSRALAAARYFLCIASTVRLHGSHHLAPRETFAVNGADRDSIYLCYYKCLRNA